MALAGPVVTFCPAIAEDIESLVALRIDAMRESLMRIGRFDPARARERLVRGFVPELTQHILLDGVRVGFLVLKPQQDVLLLEHLYIHPRYQRRGVGSAVLAHVLARADAERLEVRVVALRDSPANRFYEAHGFELVESSEFDNIYRRPVPARHNVS